MKVFQTAKQRAVSHEHPPLMRPQCLWCPAGICCVCVCLLAQSCLTLCDPMDCSPPGSSVLGYSPGKNARVGCHALLQWIFPTQRLNPGLPHCRCILYRLSHQGSPRILEWVAYTFSSRSSRPGIELGSPVLQVDPFPTKLSGKPFPW